MTSRRILSIVACWLLTVSTASTAIEAVDLDEWLEIHGFGGWAYAETDGNRYLLASAEGEAENLQFVLNLKAAPHEKLSIVAQINFEQTLQTEDEEVELDYMFAEWAFSDRLKARFGRIKHPIGLYGEIFDVGTVRPFYQLPQSIYGPHGVTAKSFNGIGLTGILLSGGWGWKYDVYGGQITGDFGTPGIFLGDDALLDPWVEEEYEVEDVVGVKLDVLAPVPGLVFGFSAYDGRQGSLFNNFFPFTVDYEVRGVHAEYVSDRWSVRGEFIAYEQSGILEAESSYVELARRFGDHWQIAARADLWDAEERLNLSGVFPGVDAVLRSEDFGLTVNYWATTEFVLRAEFHQVDGNRLAFPEDSGEILQFLLDGSIEGSTDVVLFGVQFSF